MIVEDETRLATLVADGLARAGITSEVVHDGTHSDVIFPSAEAWRRYVFSLPDREMACDCTDWHWMQRMDDNEGVAYVMVGGINVSSLMSEFSSLAFVRCIFQLAD